MSSGRRKRVAPEGNSVQLEVRPGRHLRVQHLNSRPRDAKFEKEMQLFHQYRHQGFISSGPLTMPRQQVGKSKKHSEIEAKGSHPSDLEHSVDKENVDVSNTSCLESVFGEPIVSPSSGKHQTVIQNECLGTSSQASVNSTPVHSTISDKNVHSASSVQLSLLAKQAQQQNQQQSLSKKVPVSLPSNIKDTDNAQDNPLRLDLSHVTSDNVVNDPDEEPQHSISPLHPPSVHTKANDMFSPSAIHSSATSDQPSNRVTKNTGGATEDVMIFFIHGVGGSSDVWCSQISYFANLGFEVVAPDLIGHGLSCTPKQSKAYHFKEIAADLEELFDKYCKRKNVVIGHSYGASFATLIARNRARRVNKLILVSGGPPTPLSPQPGVFDLPVCLLCCVQPCIKCGFYSGAFYKKRKPIIPKKEAFNIPTYVLQNTMNGQIWSDGDELYHNWLTCDCLLVYGEHDQLVSLEEEEHMAEAIAGSKLEVVKEASHMVMIEAPDDVNSLIHQFIQQQSTSQEASANRNINTSNEHETSYVPSETRQHHLIHQRSKSRMSQRSLKSAKSHRTLSIDFLSKGKKK